MSAPKLYFILITNNIVSSVTTFRELDALRQAWDVLDINNQTALLHCGFERPKLSEKIELPESAGKVIYTSALKWALPSSYTSTSQPIVHIVINDQITPCYLALNQWGYEIEDEILEHSHEPSILSLTSQNQKDTISLAAQQVLIDANKTLLNKEEIYARIIESNYYQFNTPIPVHVLDVTLNRETKGTEYTKASKTPVFGKSKDGRYYLLADKATEPTGWVYELSTENNNLYKTIQEYKVSDEESYRTIQSELPIDVIEDLDSYRFRFLEKTINVFEPNELLKIAPQWLLDRNVKDVGFTVRVENSLLANNIIHVGQLAELTVEDLKRLPNMGKKSINDICNAIKENIDINNVSYLSSHDSKTIGCDDAESSDSETGEASLLELTMQLPLHSHLDRTLEELTETDRLVLHDRLGYKGKVLTLEEIAIKLSVTRERVRQRQKKYVEKIIAKEYWDNVIGIRIGQLLMDREEPLILEMLDIEDEWFEGFSDCYLYLGNVIQMFSENAIQVIEAQGRNVVTRISKKVWDILLRDIKNHLRASASEQLWTRIDVGVYCESRLAEHSSKELLPLVREAIDDYLQFDGDVDASILIAYGRSAESAVKAVLAQAEKPLHYSEISVRAEEVLGQPVEERRAHNAAASLPDVWLFDRGTYGLIDHCPLPESKRTSIRQIVEHLLYQGEINKQWHSKEIIDHLKNNFPAIPDELDPYVLRMCVEGSKKVSFLNRMVWARADSGLGADDRVDVSDAFIQILKEAGEPLSGKELKNRLSDIRGVDENMQIHASERLVAVGPNVWGLSEWT